MKNRIKERVTVTIDPNLIAVIDQEIRAHHAASRSMVIEEALRLWRTEQKRHMIEKGVSEYYSSRSKQEQREDQTWSRLASRHTQRLWND